ncbi:Homeodomain-like protein, partial [Lactarius deliciosus]
GNRRHIPKEQKWLIITMSAHLSNHDIAVATEISERTIRRVLKRWRETGDVICRPLQAGRPRELTSLEVSYLEGLITRSPDLYLTELKECLEETYGVGVDERTISNSL